MRIKRTHLLIAALATGLIFTGCSTTDDNQNGVYSSGIFVVNEGSFGQSNGEISFIDRSTGNVVNGIYGLANNSLQLGDVVQSLTIVNDKAYIVVNNSNKIEITDAGDFTNQGTISSLEMPRFMVADNGKGYLTQWVNFGVNGKVSVIDLSTNTITGNITVGKAPEKMLVHSGKLFVANSNDTSISVIDLSSGTLSATVSVSAWPSTIEAGSDGNIWVFSSGIPSWSAGGPTNAAITVINPTTYAIVKNIDLGQSTDGSAQFTANASGSVFYYQINSNIYQVPVASTTAPASSFISSGAGAYGLKVDPQSGNVYVADAGAFTSNGWVRWYNGGTGTVIDSANVLLAPNGFVFN